MKNRATTRGTTEHTREQPRTTENQQDEQSEKDKQNQKHTQKQTSQTAAKKKPNQQAKRKARDKPTTKPTSQTKGKSQHNRPTTQTSTQPKTSSATNRHSTHETRKPASRHQPPSQVSGAPPLRGEHLKGVELHGGGAELKPGPLPRPRRQVVTRNPNHLHPTDAVARKLAHNAHAKPPAVALREEGARLRLRPRPKPPPLKPRLRLGRKGDGSMDVRRRLTILPHHQGPHRPNRTQPGLHRRVASRGGSVYSLMYSLRP